jgi:hypothetical protein
MALRFRVLIIILLFNSLIACTLPGIASPTPFTFPTPNMTHTAIFAITTTDIPPTAALSPFATSTIEATTSITTVVPIDTPIVAVTDLTSTSLPSATIGVLSSRPNGSPVTATFLSAPPTIDGDLSEWVSTTYTVNQLASQASDDWTGESDLSAIYFIGWDANYLYVAVRRTDDKFVQISWGRYMYRGDDIEIQLDTDLAGDFYTTAMSSDDYQIGLSPGNFGSLGMEAYRWYPRYLESWLYSVVVEAKLINEGYDLEAKIPWSVFNVNPAGGSRFGFALSLSDNDIAGSSIQQSMVSSVNTRLLSNPTTWGTLILEQPPGK